MTASIHALGKGSDAGLYYISADGRPPQSAGRDEYYSSDGGVWWSNRGTLVRNNTPVDPATFRLLCAGFDPRTGKPLVKGAGKAHRAGWDITFSAPKSLSVLWMAGTSIQREVLLGVHEAAVERALAIAASEGLFQIRMGAGGSHREPATDLIIGRFSHSSSRAGDCNLHTHCVVMNAAGSSDERFRTLETGLVYEFQLVLGAAYRAEVAEQLHDLGFAIRRAGANQIEIDGISPAVLEVFSKRSAQIRHAVGNDATAAEKEIAALATRETKNEVPTAADLELRWQAELLETGVDVWQQALEYPAPARRDGLEYVAPPLSLDPPAIDGDGPVVRAARALFAHESVLTRKSLLHRAFVEGSYVGSGIALIQNELQSLEQDRKLIALDGARRLSGWTTEVIAALELSLRKSADRLSESEWIAPSVVEEALLDHQHLSDEQRLAVAHALGTDGVSIIEAGAGTGKTTLAAALVGASRLANKKIVGLAPSWVAADQLRRETGIDAAAIAKWRHDIRSGRRELDGSSIVIVDEAGMVGLSDMEDILRRAQLSGAKVVLVGDRRQLEPVGPGGALRLVAEIVARNATLQSVRRQTVEWQLLASELMVAGQAASGLFAYSRNERVAFVSGDEAARARAISEWSRLRQLHGSEVLIVTRRNRDAEELNRAARIQLRAQGLLRGEDVAVETIDAEGKSSKLLLAQGDRIRFRQPAKDIGVRNGTLAAVLEIVATEDPRDPLIKARLQTGPAIEFRWQSLSNEFAFKKGNSAPRVTHAYAGTIHSAQGRTVDAAVMYVSGTTDAREIYVGLTRHRHDALVIVESDRLDAIAARRFHGMAPKPSDSVRLQVLLGEADIVREKLNVADFVQPLPKSILRRAFDAARDLVPSRHLSVLVSAMQTFVDRSRKKLLELNRSDGRTR